MEARQYLVEVARQNVEAYGVTDVEFIRGNVLTDLDKAGPIDTVLCFGFLYHTIDYMPFFRSLAALGCQRLLIDTAISLLPGSVMEIDSEKTEHESTGAFGEPGTPEETLVGRPTKQAFGSYVNVLRVWAIQLLRLA